MHVPCQASENFEVALEGVRAFQCLEDRGQILGRHADRIQRVHEFTHARSLLNFHEFFSVALTHGVLLRPIGKTVYFMPPYVVKEDEFAWLVKQTIATIDKVIAA